jgi:hypothetical protein
MFAATPRACQHYRIVETDPEIWPENAKSKSENGFQKV